MYRRIGFAAIASASLLCVSAAAAGDGVAVNITNDSTDDILVTVYDTTVGPNAVVLAHVRVNGFTTIPLTMAPDETGHANVAWTAVTVDANGRRCGHAESVGLADASAVTVHADSTCAASATAATFRP
jgi:hypothetical protein